jgi:hypothetical protein
MTDFLLVGGRALAIYGTAILFGIGIAAMAAWLGHTEASRVLAGDVDTALASVGKIGVLAVLIFHTKETTAAPRLSRALRIGEPLNLWRLAGLGEDFWVPFCTLVLRRYGATVFSPQQTELLRGAARTGAKTMAHMRIAIDAGRKQA